MSRKNRSTHFDIAGFFRAEKRKILRIDMLTGDPIYSEPEDVLGWQPNLIPDPALDLMSGGTVDNMTFCRLGTGNNPPSTADVALQAQVGSSNTAAPTGAASGFGTGNEYAYRRKAYRFAAGVVSGLNLTEVGVGATSSGTILTRALLKDMSGVPTVISLAADEVLDVIYELRLYADTNTKTTTEMIDGISTTVDLYPIGWGIVGSGSSVRAPWSPVSPLIGSAICGTNNSAGAVVMAWLPLENAPDPAVPPTGFKPTNPIAWAAYVPGSFTRSFVITFTLTEANFPSGIGGFTYGCSGSSGVTPTAGVGVGQWGLAFNPKIQKDSTKTVSFSSSISWGRKT